MPSPASGGNVAVKLIVPGIRIEESDLGPLHGGSLQIETVYAAKVEMTTRGTVLHEAVFDAEPDDIVELEWQSEENLREWLSVGRLAERFGPPAAERSAVPVDKTEPAQFRIPATWTQGTASRGWLGWVLKSVKVRRLTLPPELLGRAAHEIAAHFEARLDPGLFRLGEDFELQPLAAGSHDLSRRTAKPFLVFLHGTASSTGGSFGKLAATRDWLALRARYDPKSILAFDHPTLSVSPVANAIDLAGQLPKGARLHLVSHSRGGLIGELLCRGAIAKAELRPFQATRPDFVDQLEQLSALVKEKDLRVERFVRVACPARGTILASGRLDCYLSLLVNLFGLIPALRISPLYGVLTDTLLALARTRADPKQLPGLEAQMPESPLIHLLNREGIPSSADLAVIAGDIQGGSLWRRLGTLATDLFYWEDHDLVVNTRSMYGGVGRSAGRAYFYFERGPEVNHFSYFLNPGTRERACSWLAATDGQVDAAWKALTPEVRAGSQARGQAAQAQAEEQAKDLPVVFLIPDFMGSTLVDLEATVWPDRETLARDGTDRLAIATALRPAGLLSEAYEDLVQSLRRRYRVHPFPYDWRRSVRETAELLEQAVRNELDGDGRKVRLLAHGLGGLVAGAMIVKRPDLWRQLVQRGGRLVMLGTPHRGTSFALRVLTGQAKLVSYLALLDFSLDQERHLDMLMHWPSLVEMLPEAYLSVAGWAGLKGLDDSILAPARAVRAELSKLSELVEPAPEGRNAMVSVLGTAPWTPEGVGDVWAVAPPALGDGRVVHQSAQLPGVASWFIDAPHGAMARHPAAFLGILDLLDNGITAQLSDQPLASSRPVSAFHIGPEAPLLFPDQEDLLAAALCFEPAAPAAEMLQLHISVAHGHLRHARHPVLVGHYAGDTIVHAERALDDLLGGALSARYRLALYPGPEGTAEVVLDGGLADAPTPNSACRGALVVGLGEVGDVGIGKVAEGVELAALRYALLVAERPARDGEGQRFRSAAVSALLLGTGGGRPISAQDSVAAVVRGILRANRSLKNQGMWERVRIDEIEFVEMYQSVAIQAAHAVLELHNSPRVALEKDEWLEPARHLRTLSGGRVCQPSTNPYDTGWWKRVLIKSTSGGDLRFEVLTERARSEQRRQFLQSAMVDDLMAESIAQKSYDPRLASTLFELLLPLDIKEQTTDDADLVLVVDDGAAAYPWEMLAERQRDPVATRVGLVRQLRVEASLSRPRPRPPHGRFALVVGDPRSSRLSELPGAQQEAQAVAAALAARDYHVTLSKREAGIDILKALFANEYQVIHLAGHGEYRPEKPKKSGMVIGDGTFLTAAELRQLRTVPQLVFINCCHLGQMAVRPQLVRLAASLATELIRMSVRAVVAAGWAVDDRLSEFFAHEFYEALLCGETFGRAVLMARRRTFQQNPESNTWGAFQCYGDPDFVLDPKLAPVGAARDGWAFVSRRELLEELADLGTCACSRDPIDGEAIRVKLGKLGSAIPADWRDGEVHAAEARVWRALGCFDQAIKSYGEAARATMPVPIAEAQAKVEIELAAQVRLGAGSGRVKQEEKLLAAAVDRLEALGERTAAGADLAAARQRLAELRPAHSPRK
jgi:hypothetical protein